MLMRWWVPTGLVVALLAVAAAVWLFATRPHLATAAACARLKAGTTAAEAETILGTRKALCLSGHVDGQPYEGYLYPAESGTVQIRFEQGKVTEVRFRPGDCSIVGHPSLTDRLRAWLGW
jgi:hypothetical protein